ncbi:hypothetical protein PsYK624_166640 [Phanerochaete sordida]|uniref:Uncharacterized protein n=1 Tax=Phanerochaete sordida TaxID=48140 RepID=A0A9P3LMA9_9APHY|nr:hypothetical protein PsYK624_166640 [Phanerochaete sordida]
MHSDFPNNGSEEQVHASRDVTRAGPPPHVLFPNRANGLLKINLVCNASAASVSRAKALVDALTLQELTNNTVNGCLACRGSDYPHITGEAKLCMVSQEALAPASRLYPALHSAPRSPSPNPSSLAPPSTTTSSTASRPSSAPKRVHSTRQATQASISSHRTSTCSRTRTQGGHGCRLRHDVLDNARRRSQPESRHRGRHQKLHGPPVQLPRQARLLRRAQKPTPVPARLVRREHAVRARARAHRCRGGYRSAQERRHTPAFAEGEKDRARRAVGERDDADAGQLPGCRALPREPASGAPRSGLQRRLREWHRH